jgi:hypothetical protein
MRFRMFRLVATLGAAWLATLLSSHRAMADVIIAPGYDIFHSLSPGTSFAGVPFMGVSLGTFNFGGTIGTQSVGNADTIIHRTSSVDATLSGSTPLTMLALQLETVAPTNVFGPLDNYFVTLQSARGGPATVGTITITPTTFSSSIDVFFDIREGSLTGPIVRSGDETLLTSTTAPAWNQSPPPGAVLINGANSNQNGTDHSGDFYPAAPFSEASLLAAHGVFLATVPEPSMIATGSLTLLFGAALAWRRSRKQLT